MGLEVGLRIEMKRRSLRGSSALPTSPKREAGVLSAKGNQSGRKHMETRRKTQIPSEIKIMKTVIIKELSCTGFPVTLVLCKAFYRIISCLSHYSSERSDYCYYNPHFTSEKIDAQRGGIKMQM